MKYISLFLTSLFLFASCTANRHVKVTVSNNTPNERNEEIIEISLKEISARLQLADSSHFIILDKDKKEIPYQITYDRKVIFPVSEQRVCSCIPPEWSRTDHSSSSGTSHWDILCREARLERCISIR